LNFASGSFTQGGSTANGSASAGNGSISAFAAASDFGASPNSLGSFATHAVASLSDSFRVTADTDVPLKFEFGLRATGNVSTFRSGENRGRDAGIPSVSVEWNVGLSGGPSSLSTSGSVSEGYRPEVVEGFLVWTLVRQESGLTFNDFTMIAVVVNGTVGQTFSLSMSAKARAATGSGRVGSGASSSGAADFGSTLRWMGLRNITFADGTPYTGAVTITSSSGHNYLRNVSNCPADLNFDAVVDDADFTPFVLAYDILDCSDPAMPTTCPADLNGDDVVDDDDFLIFVLGYNDLLCP
jgi:hypothetical protein